MVLTVSDLYHLPMDELIAAAKRQLVGRTAKYYPEMDRYYCPVCGGRVRKYQNHCNECGQLLDGTHDGIKPEIIDQEPVTNNETGEVDWGNGNGNC